MKKKKIKSKLIIAGVVGKFGIIIIQSRIQKREGFVRSVLEKALFFDFKIIDFSGDTVHYGSSYLPCLPRRYAHVMDYIFFFSISSTRDVATRSVQFWKNV